MHRRWGDSRISRAPVALAGARAPSAPAWVGWLLANFIAGSAWFPAKNRGGSVLALRTIYK